MLALEEATALREGVLRVDLNLDYAKYVPRRHHGLACVQVRALWPTVCETFGSAHPDADGAVEVGEGLVVAFHQQVGLAAAAEDPGVASVEPARV